MSTCTGDGISCNLIQVPHGNDKCLPLNLYVAPEDKTFAVIVVIAQVISGIIHQ